MSGDENMELIGNGEPLLDPDAQNLAQRKRKFQQVDLVQSPSQIEGDRRSSLVDTTNLISTLRIPESERPVELYHGLTAHLWRKVLDYLPPASLGRLLSVSRNFQRLLTASVGDQESSGQDECETIWKTCHRRFTPGLPQPMENQSELSMWMLIKGVRCQRCGEKKSLQTLTTSSEPWLAGPDHGRCRVLWTFRVRLCLDCLSKSIKTEKDLVLDRTVPSFLIDGLPYMFQFENRNLMSETVFRATTLPVDLKPTKIYYESQVRMLQEQYQKLKNRPDELDRWIQSLQIQRQKLEDDASRWEQWERKGALSKINTKPPRKNRPGKDQATSSKVLRGTVPNQTSELSKSHQLHLPKQTPGAKHDSAVLESLSHAEDMAVETTLPSSSHTQETFPGAQDVISTRRSQIEHHCMALDPPITPSELERMASFQAALSIAKEFDDQQWTVLKERLESERSNRQTGTNMSASTPGGPGLGQARAGNQSQDHRNESSTLHDELSHIATSIIDSKWNGGKSLSKDSSFQFAADILVSTREAFCERHEEQTSSFANDTSRTLCLEDLRWLFDKHVKPLTVVHSKEIFLCHDCQNTSKAYGLEAVIQHYAAKHTKTLSLGSAVVNWKALWSAKPPFHPNPMLVKALAIAASTSTGLQSYEDQTGVANLAYHVSQSKNPQQVQPDSQAERPKHLHTASWMPTEPSYNGDPTYRDQHRHLPIELHGNDPTWHQQRSTAPSAMIADTSDFSYGHNSSAPVNNFSHGIDNQSPVARPNEVGFPTTDTFQIHQNEMAKMARHFWFATAGIKGLPGPVRVQAIIHHACEQFVQRYHLEPGVNMFLFGLNYDPAMRPLRSLYGFACSACITNKAGAIPVSERRQSATLPHLLNHFMTSHAEYHGLDWRTDMIKLPPLHVISTLSKAQGMDDSKLSIIASAFPEAFASPVPDRNAPSILQYTSTPIDTPNPSAYVQMGGIKREDYQPSNLQGGYSGIISSADVSSDVTRNHDDDYDPRTPSYVGKIVRAHEGVPLEPSDLGAFRGQTTTSTTGNVRYLPARDADRFLDGLQADLTHEGKAVRSTESFVTSTDGFGEPPVLRKSEMYWARPAEHPGHSSSGLEYSAPEYSRSTYVESQPQYYLIEPRENSDNASRLHTLHEPGWKDYRAVRSRVETQPNDLYGYRVNEYEANFQYRLAPSLDTQAYETEPPPPKRRALR